jgi:Ca2+-binding EF-hand superfamily protein
MSVRQSLLFFSLAALAVAGTAAAQDRDQTFRDRDRNDDGVLTQSEYGGHPGNFRALDVNGDGVLSYGEFVRRHGGDDRVAGFADPFTMMDRNRDGVLTMKEYDGSDAMFRQLDRNDNGLLSRAEYNNDEMRSDLTIQRRYRNLDRNDDWRLSRGEAQLTGSDFNVADKNRNGYLSLAEFTVWTDRYAGNIREFDTLDRNNDGVISWGEWRSEQRDAATFDRLDRNDDRLVSRTEYDYQAAGYYGGSLEDFRSRDRNDDGLLSRSESGLNSWEFDRVDEDNDGVLTLKEYRQVSAVGDQFDVLDRNNDGYVSRWEWNGDRDDFDRMDRDNDGVLSRSEYDRRSGGFLGSILGRVEDVRFNEMDVNNDGVLRPSEWHGSMGEFDRLDANNDGVVTLFEFTR